MSFHANSVRSQFLALNIPVVDDMLPIFFDNPAGTQVPQRVIDAVGEYYRTMNANAGGIFATSQRSDAMMQRTREKAMAFLNANRPEEIVFGQNMTTLNFALSHALARTLNAGDEIVLTHMDHDANVSPWLHIAQDHGLTVRWVDILKEDCTLDINSLEAALTNKTKIVAAVHASNAVGTINPVKQIAEMAHAAGALFVMDAVQSAPHVPIDVQEIGCDFMLCSAYKFFGPHIGIMWGKYELLESLPVYKVRPAKDVPPYRWETGTLSFETINAVGAALDYIAEIGEEYGSGDASAIHRGMTVIGDYERELVAYLIEQLQTLPNVTIAGITDPAHYQERVPTVALVMEGHTPAEIQKYLGEHHIYVWSGHYYAIEIMAQLGRSEHGMVRVGLAHYNTREEIDRMIEVLRGLS